MTTNKKLIIGGAIVTFLVIYLLRNRKKKDAGLVDMKNKSFRNSYYISKDTPVLEDKIIDFTSGIRVKIKSIEKLDLLPPISYGDGEMFRIKIDNVIGAEEYLLQKGDKVRFIFHDRTKEKSLVEGVVVEKSSNSYDVAYAIPNISTDNKVKFFVDNTTRIVFAKKIKN